MPQGNPVYVRVGGEFDEGRPVALPLHRQRDARGVVPPSRGRRKEWWWQPGPVDTVGFCWDLDMGVGLNAVGELVYGILAFASIGHRLAADTSTVVVQEKEEEFARDCEGLEQMPYKCERLIGSILELTLANDTLVPNVLAAAVLLMLGWLGLRAWWCFDARAAKFNLWLRPLMFLMSAVVMAIRVTKEMSYGRHPVWDLYVFWLLLMVLSMMYSSKVMWSYHIFLLKKTSRATREAGMVELDATSPTV
ncbi:expressed unknown protein [Ectocarpus siliculosus]|uniref:Uncharacterized protein n=1 Tax=Ectocarpus siliculosus TaxID=2880 RepID=D8LKG8_ECTSI|nr:expressed unknown protein [Ectocarpus siliculosus]|eukprot:CBN74558.1 expressed unknown protein [Ectocarpus siliculosus]